MNISGANENLQDNGNAGVDEEAESTISKESDDEEFSDDADDDWYNELDKSRKNLYII